MKTKSINIILLVVTLVCLLCTPMQVFAESQGTNGDELQIMEAETLEIQLGTDWAGVEFRLKTDAGLYPGTVVVGDDGVLRLEIGGSKTYTLTCMNSDVDAPDPTQAPATTEGTESQADESASTESNAATVAGIPVKHIVLFSVGMVAAIGALIAMHVVKSRRDSEPEYDEDEDE